MKTQNRSRSGKANQKNARTSRVTSKRGSRQRRKLPAPTVFENVASKRTPQRFTWVLFGGRVSVNVYEVKRPDGSGFRWEWSIEFRGNGLDDVWESEVAFTHFTEAQENLAQTLGTYVAQSSCKKGMVRTRR